MPPSSRSTSDSRALHLGTFGTRIGVRFPVASARACPTRLCGAASSDATVNWFRRRRWIGWQGRRPCTARAGCGYRQATPIAMTMRRLAGRALRIELTDGLPAQQLATVRAGISAWKEHHRALTTGDRANLLGVVRRAGDCRLMCWAPSRCRRVASGGASRPCGAERGAGLVTMMIGWPSARSRCDAGDARRYS